MNSKAPLIALAIALCLNVKAQAQTQTTPATGPSTGTSMGATGILAPGLGVPNLDDKASFIERYPDLDKFISRERSSNLIFGFGVSPVVIVNGKFGFAASLFQLHYMKAPWDVELLNVSFGTAFGEALAKEQFFLLRMAPKYKIWRGLSIGPVLGIEFVHFPEVKAALTNGPPSNDFSEQFDFSTFGYFYGGAISQTFELGTTGEHALRVSAIFYKEQYSVTETKPGWSYYFLQNELNSDKGPIAPSSMLMLEISYLY